MSDLLLSVVIPAYNEEKRLPESLKKIKHFLRSQPYSSEIIVVDDGSSDKTLEAAQRELDAFKSKVISNPGNKGKGYSVRNGVLHAGGRYILFSDADLSTPIEEITGFLTDLQEGSAGVVIGSRAIDRSSVEVRQNPFREFMGRTFNFLAQALTFKGIQDSQCGFKAFTRQAAFDLFSRQTLDRFGFDVEIIYLAQKLGYKVIERPVVWRNSEGSRVRIVSDSLNMFLDLLRIRWAHRNLQKK